MRNIFIAIIRRLLAVTLLVLTVNVHPVLAQKADSRAKSGSSPDFVTANYSTRLARYYAPYALQAAAAYISVSSMDERLKLPRGSDVEWAVGQTIDDQTVIDKAAKYLRAWRYRFGSESYLNCYESDPDCVKGSLFAIPAGPAFHVWTRAGKTESACSEVSIAFRGTDGGHGWIRWLLDWGTGNFKSVTGNVVEDYYRQLQRNINAILNKISRLPCYKEGGRPQIVSVGHSLGGGLAQLAALANNPGDKRLRIAKVFAFDSSPITGASYVSKRLQDQNADVEIDLAYQSKEILEQLRPTKPSSPCVRTVRFDAIQPAGGAILHNMPALARELVRMTYDVEDDEQAKYRKPVKLLKCDSRYVVPKTDEYIEPAPDGTVMSNRDGSPRVASVNRGGMNSYAMAGGFGFSSPQSAEMSGSVSPRNARRSDASMGSRAGRGQAPAVQVSFEAAWPPG